MITINTMIRPRIALVLMALGFPTLAVAAVQVELEVDGSKLVVTRNTAQCPGGPIDCIEVKRGSNPHLYFNLKRACKNNGPVYKLKAFRIGMKNKVWPTPSNRLTEEVAEDFGAGRGTGYIDFTKNNNQLTDGKMKLKDHNRNPATVFYEVTAAHCTDMTAPDIHLDPQIKNGGRN